MFTLRQAFVGQNPTEPVFILVRSHPLGFLPYLVIVGGMGLVGLVLLITTLALQSQLSALPYNVMLTASGLFLLFSIVFSLVVWIDFYFDIQIVTDRRIIDVNQNRLFDRHVAELNLEDIEDVSVQVSGALPTLFNYGDVVIQTAGERANFHFRHIPHPREVGTIISDLAEQAKRGVPTLERYPTSEATGVIAGRVIKTQQDLIRLGVHLTPRGTSPKKPRP